MKMIESTYPIVTFFSEESSGWTKRFGLTSLDKHVSESGFIRILRELVIGLSAMDDAFINMRDLEENMNRVTLGFFDVE
jgi:hypothetical protein